MSLSFHNISIDHKGPDEKWDPVEEEQSHESGDSHEPSSNMAMEDEYPFGRVLWYHRPKGWGEDCFHCSASCSVVGTQHIDVLF